MNFTTKNLTAFTTTLLFSSLIIASSNLHAQPLLWTVQGSNNSTISSFTYNADTNEISNFGFDFSLTAYGGDLYPVMVDPKLLSVEQDINHSTRWYDDYRIYTTEFHFNNPLTSAGGKIKGIYIVSEMNYSNGSWNQLGTIGSELFTISAVPEPETFALILAGLGLIGIASRRKQST